MDQMIEETPHSRYSKASWNSELNTWREVSSRSIDDDDIGDTTIATSIVTKVNGNDDADGNDDDGGSGGDTKGDSDEELGIHIDRIFDHGM